MSAPKNAIPTPRGWVHETTGELLKSQILSSDFIETWHGTSEIMPKLSREKNFQPATVVEKIQTLHEAPVDEEFVPDEKYQYFASENNNSDGEEE